MGNYTKHGYNIIEQLLLKDLGLVPKRFTVQRNRKRQKHRLLQLIYLTQTRVSRVFDKTPETWAHWVCDCRQGGYYVFCLNHSFVANTPSQSSDATCSRWVSPNFEYKMIYRSPEPFLKPSVVRGRGEVFKLESLQPHGACKNNCLAHACIRTKLYNNNKCIFTFSRNIFCTDDDKL